jgi:phospholipase/carboxylesterase
MTEILRKQIAGIWSNIRIPEEGRTTPVLLALHGLSGDENAMGIFAERIPDRFLVISPRGIYPSALGGYSWVENAESSTSTLADFHQAVIELQGLLDQIKLVFSVTPVSLHLIGFSQGAALCYSCLYWMNDQFSSIAAISGFLPQDFFQLNEDSYPTGIKTFIAHGTNDPIVPIEAANKAADILSHSGSKITFCEAGVGHKISASCFQALGNFYRELA